MTNKETQSILVVGGGMSGLTAAIEAAEAGYDTYIVERNPIPGGKGGAAAPLFPEALPAVLRPGDQLPPHPAESKGQVLHHGGSGEDLPGKRGTSMSRSG